MTLTEMYELKLKERQPSPAITFLREVASLTHKGELAVRRWIKGETTPDPLTQEVLAKHFNTTPEELFPKK